MDSAIEFFCGGAEIRNFFVGCGRVSWMSMWSGITPAEVCAVLEGEMCREGACSGGYDIRYFYWRWARGSCHPMPSGVAPSEVPMML